MDLEQGLRTVSDEMLRTLDQLQRLELEKRSESPGSPRFLTLATEIEKLAAMMFAQTNTQEKLAAESHAATRAGADLAPIEEVTPTRDVSLILSDWREAERRVAGTAIDSAEHAKAAGDVRRLRDEYHRAYKAQSTEERPPRS
jgi:hypothetical protein